MRVTGKENFRLAATERLGGAPPSVSPSSGTTCGSPAPAAAGPSTKAGSSPMAGTRTPRFGTVAPPSLDPTQLHQRPALSVGRADQRQADRYPPGWWGAGSGTRPGSGYQPAGTPPTAGSPTRLTCVPVCGTPRARRCWPVTSGGASNEPSRIPTRLGSTTTRRQSSVRRLRDRGARRRWPRSAAAGLRPEQGHLHERQDGHASPSTSRRPKPSSSTS